MDGLQLRERQSAILSIVMLVFCRELHKAYNHHKNISANFPDLICIMAIRINDVRKRKPCSINRISKTVALPRANTKRCLDKLVKSHVIDLVPINNHHSGYVCNKQWLASREHAAYFRRAMGACIGAGRTLKKIKKKYSKEWLHRAAAAANRH